MKNCVFCKISSGEISAELIYEDEQILCFKDLDPQAPVHVLIIPKKHISSIQYVSPEDKDLIGHMMLKIREIADTLGLDNGYRVVINCGDDGLQTVKHLHIHLLGKRKMTWPPG